MTSPGHRLERITEEIRNEVSLMLAGELRDPRLAVEIDITEVRVSPDLRSVNVFVLVPGEPKGRDRALRGMSAAAGYIRHELVERLKLRRAPEIHFRLDDSEEYSKHIEDLLRKSKSSGEP
ncbi:MAG: 30S ribosome-binding factor RbfA [Candidatus Acidiferrales bacterium]